MRSDDEEDDDEMVGKEGQANGKYVGIAGDEKVGIEDARINGVKAANGYAVANHDSYKDAVVEGKKQR